MSRAWDKEKIWVPDGIWTYDLPNFVGRVGAPCPLELRGTHGEWGHILGSYLTRVLHTARISKVAVVLCGNDARIHALVPFATSSTLALKDTSVGARNLSNHAKASSWPLFANLKILDVSIYSLQVLSCTYIIMMLYLFLLLQSFILEIRFINIQPDTLTFTDLRPVEQILKKIPSCLKVLEYGIHYRTTSKTPQLLISSSVWLDHF